MSAIEGLVESARREAEAPYAEAARMMGICNSCRYCEGYCAAFQAMERRVAFDAPALDYLANLCHHCGACLYACQYAPPHAFAVNIPRALSRVRVASYEHHAWPRAFGALYRRQPVLVSVSLAASLAAMLLLAVVLVGPRGLAEAPARAADFYSIFPHGLMVAIFGATFLYAILAMAIGAARFRATLHGGGAPVPAAVSALRLDNLEGGGEGCYHQSGITHLPSRARKRLHHYTFWGFMLCFASTTLATMQHYLLGERAPYPLTSLVVMVGTLGGVALLVGTGGLLRLRGSRDPDLVDAGQAALDAGFLGLLWLTAATGLALVFLRETAAMPVLLAVHLGVVLALFLTLPYGKFVHGLYRYLALSRHERERREPNPLNFGDP